MPKKILIIEDDQALAKNLELALKDYQVCLAATGEEGLEQVKKQKPDLIFLDVMLPDIQGPAVLDMLKKNNDTADIPVIILTNLDDSETVSRVLAAGGRDYLVKTDWSVDQIIAKAKEALE